MIPRFRYYDTLLNKYIYSEEFDIEDECLRISQLFINAKHSLYPIDQSLDCYDRNHTEIYENDIVSVVEEYYPDTEEEFNLLPRNNLDISILPFKEIRKDLVFRKFNHYWLKNEMFGYEGEELISPSDCIIVGAKYTHPELMAEVK